MRVKSSAAQGPLCRQVRDHLERTREHRIRICRNMRRFRHQSCKAWAKASSPHLEQVTIATSAILTYPHILEVSNDLETAGHVTVGLAPWGNCSKKNTFHLIEIPLPKPPSANYMV